MSKSTELLKERKEMWLYEEYKLLKLFEEKKEEKKDDNKGEKRIVAQREKQMSR